MKKIITITFLSLLFLTQAFAQSAGTKKSDSVEVEYDKSKNKTTVTLILPLTSDDSAAVPVVFGSIDVYNGKVRSDTPDKVIVTFIAVSRQKQFSSSSSWTVVADNERIKMGTGEYVSEANNSGTAEILLFAFSVENLEKIINAKNVTMQVGSKEFTLTQAQIDSLKEYYKKLSS